jgi:hypothetical protein
LTSSAATSTLELVGSNCIPLKPTSKAFTSLNELPLTSVSVSSNRM